MARSHIGLALPWLVVIGRVFGRLDLRNVDRALPTCRKEYISRKGSSTRLFLFTSLTITWAEAAAIHDVCTNEMAVSLVGNTTYSSR